MDKVNYLEEANRQLTDERFYKKLDSDPTKEFSTKITQELTIMKKNSHIHKNTFDYLKPDKPKAGRFYLLPKIHSQQPQETHCFRKWAAHRQISEFVDFHLRLHVEALPSHLKETTDYLQNFHRGPFLFTWTLRHYTLASHIMTVSKHVERPGTKESLKNHQRNVLSSCSHWYWSITTLHLMESMFYKSTEPLWEQRWHLQTPTFSWGNLKN